jgi:cell wall-associated NlpC family hydrolase
MKLLKNLYLFILLFQSTFIFSQKKFIEHTITQGQTVYSIAKLYQTTATELIKTNPEAYNGIKIGDVLLIENKNTTQNINEQLQHLVQPKETVYGISKMYQVSQTDLRDANPEIKLSGLKIGQSIKIPSHAQPITIAQNTKNDALQKDNLAQNNETSAAVEESTKIETKTNYSEFLSKDEIANQLVLTSADYLGIRYRYGGTGKSGIDCSALICSIYQSYNIELPRTSAEQASQGTIINNAEAKKGDLIFFKTSGRNNHISHVGMITDVDNGEIKFIHASSSAGVIISSLNESYYTSRMAQINRVL